MKPGKNTIGEKETTHHMKVYHMCGAHFSPLMGEEAAYVTAYIKTLTLREVE